MLRVDDGGGSGNVNRTTRTNFQQDQTNTVGRNAKTTVNYDDKNAFGHIVETVVKAAKTIALAAKTAQASKTPAQQNISYDRFDKTLDYMFNEMKMNINSSTVKNIKAQLDYANHLMNPKGFKETILAGLAQAGGDNAVNHIQAALIEWGLKVRPGGDWDHKPKLDQMLGLGKDKDYYFPIRGDNQHEVFYDIWSNIHYGYVGAAAGLDGKTLQDGASVADGIAGRNDKVDEVTVQIGIDMWNKYGANLTKKQFHQEILNHLPAIIAAQKSQDSHQVIPITNGR